MSIRHLGESIDIHGGGADLIFPHHENEIAQSEAYTGKPFARYWVHNGFITVDKEKMSKSLGNFFTMREILDVCDPEVVRLFLLSSHYRSPIEFSQEQLRDAESSLDRYYTTRGRIDEFLSRGAEGKKKGADPAGFDKILTEAMQGFDDAMDDDFNTAQAIGHVFECIREVNRFLDSKPAGESASKVVTMAREMLETMGRVLNLFRRTPLQWNRDLLQTKKIPLTEEDIHAKIEERRNAREQKDWARADSIRNALEDQGVVLEDKKDGTAWRIKIA
jgi:cysteinyl-tRNA synthetase